jgi:hypothetical protein
MVALTANGGDLAADIKRWKDVRDEVLEHPREKTSENRLMTHVAAELDITRRMDSWSHDARLLKPKAIGYGALASAAVLAFIGALTFALRSLSFLLDRIKSLLPRRNEEEPPEKPERTEPKNGQARKDIAPTKLEPLAGTYKRAIGANGGNDMVDHLPDARGRMEADFGPESTAAVFKVLNGKLSNTLAKKVAHGNYEELRKLMLSSRKAFGVAGYDFETLERVLMPKHSLVPQYDTEKQVAFSRKRHVLDDIKRWGWAPNDFHRLLAEYGFDTSEVGGGGHCFVKYNGQKLRYSSGRFVIVPHRTTGKEITPGAAGKILKGCADFLVMHERVADAQPDEA